MRRNIVSSIFTFSIFAFYVNTRISEVNADGESTLLFVYGGYMKSKDMKDDAPGAEKFDIGIAEKYRFDFTVYTEDMDYPFDTIIKDDCEEGVWGVIWKIPDNDWQTFKSDQLSTYDFCEIGHIFVNTVNNGPAVKCAVIFVQKEFRQKKLVYGQGFPLGRRPTSQYIHSVVQGASENNLPINYIKKLQMIPTVDKEKQKTFYLFAYGANMLLSRTQETAAPSAKVYNIGMLKDTELKATYYTERLNGCVYTFVPRFGNIVWGVILEVSITEIDELDKQGGVNEGRYEEIEVKIETPDGQIIDCVTYQLQQLPRSKQEECPPSDDYQKIVLKGATENKLPEEYINYLKSLHPIGNDS